MTLIAGMTLIDFFEKFHYDDYFKYDANYFLWKYPHMTLIMCMTFIRQSRVWVVVVPCFSVCFTLPFSNSSFRLDPFWGLISRLPGF